MSTSSLDGRAFIRAARNGAAESERDAPARSPRVLVVDDDEIVRKLLHRLLAITFHCTVDEATNGAEALAALSTADYDLVLLDIRMPVLDGLSTLAQMKADESKREIPVVVLTGSHTDDVVRQALELGVADYLVKPLAPGVAAGRLGRLLTSQGTKSG